MPLWLACVGTIALSGLAFFQGLTLYRQLSSDRTYVFWRPASADSKASNKPGFFWFTAFGHAWGIVVLSLCTFVCAAFLFGLG